MTGQHRSVLSRWLDAAAQAGDRPALRDRVIVRSHRELLGIAHRRAALLLAGGLQADQRVAVVLNSCVEQATWIASVMLAGGCAVPLGLNQPEHRLRELIGLAKPSAVIADPHTWQLADGQHRYEGSHPGGSASPPLPRPGPGWAAYLCFTSGTTGSPKGVVVTHGAIAHTTGEMAAYLDLGRRPRNHVLASSWSFDVAMMDLWLALTTGGTLFAPGRDALLGPALPTTVGGLQTPVLHTVPSLFSGSSPGDLSSFPDGTTVIVGGEPAPAAVLAKLAEHTDLHVVYGITETAVITTASPVRHGMTPDVIGRPLPGSECLVADSAGMPVPDGEPGELLIGGPVLARGYLGDPAGTALRFLPGRRGGRWYRTGDRVRRRPDGMLSFNGRIDQQLKIRGHRVEPAEVEQALLSLAGVRQAAIVACQDPVGDLALVAYVSGDGLTAEAVQREIGAKVPEWMCPRAVLVLPVIPVSVTGKIDRAALPGPPWPGAGAASLAQQGHLSGTERVIGEMWRELLGPHDLAAEANFVQLGGHSLKAAQLSTALRDRLGISLQVPDVLSAATLRDLARLVDEAATGQAAAGGGRGSEPSAVQRQIWLHQELAGEAAIYNLLVSVRLRGQLRLPALQRSLHALERLHPALRTSFTFDGDKLLAVEHEPPGRPLAVRKADPSQAIRDAGARALPLSGQPPWTYELLETGPAEAVLLLVFHHIAVDGVSIYRLLTELAQGYSVHAGLGNAPAAGPPEPGPAAMTDRQDPEFWAKLMNKVPPPAHLPGQRTPSDIADFSGWCQRVELPGLRATDLRRVAAAHRVTLHTLVLSAFLRTTANATGTSDIVIGMPLSRRGLDVSFSAVGQFASVLPVRFRLPSDLSAGGCLDVVAQTVLAAQRHCTADPGVILEAVRAQQGRFTGDPFRVVFAWEDDLPAPRFAGLEASWSLEFSGWSASELTVELAPHADAIAGRVIGRRDGSAEADVSGFMRALGVQTCELAAELTHGQK